MVSRPDTVAGAIIKEKRCPKRKEESVEQEKLHVGYIYQRQDGSRFIVTTLAPGYDHIGYAQDISGAHRGMTSTEDSHTFSERGIVFDAMYNMSLGTVPAFK